MRPYVFRPPDHPLDPGEIAGDEDFTSTRQLANSSRTAAA